MRAVALQEIKERYRHFNPGGHWFDDDTMRFFGTRFAGGGYEHPGGAILFATSEQPPHGGRKGSVRRLNVEGDIDTLGEFCGYSSIGAADKAAREMCERGEEAIRPEIDD